jgi:spore coat protein U-like protein
MPARVNVDRDEEEASMRKIVRRTLLVMSAILGLLVIAPAIPEAANLTTNLQVSLTVVPSCSDVSVTPLNFGSIAQGGNTTATSTVSVTCGNGVPYTILAGFGHTETAAGRQMWLNDTDSSQVALYNLYRDSNRTQIWSGMAWGGPFSGTGTGSAQTYTAYASATSGPVPGLYQDTVNITLTF